MGSVLSELGVVAGTGVVAAACTYFIQDHIQAGIIRGFAGVRRYGVTVLVVAACTLILWDGLGLSAVIHLAFSKPAVTQLEVYPPQPKFEAEPVLRRGAIVYVHGLQGSRIDTWKNANNKTWMDLLRADPDLQNYDQYTFGFGSNITFDRTNIEEAISTLRITFDQELKPYFHLVVVAHSLGGLVSRDALVNSLAIERPGQTITFISLASPFQGSRLADALGSLTGVHSQHIDVLKTVSNFSRESGEKWRFYRKQRGNAIYHAAAYETLPLVRVGEFVPLVVDPESARREADEYKAFNEDHSSICKPADSSNLVYAWAKEIIRRRERELVVYPSLPKGFNVVKAGPDATVPGMFHRVVLGPGEIEIDAPMRIPETVTLFIKPDTTLRFSKGAILESEGRVLAGIDPKWFESEPGESIKKIERTEDVERNIPASVNVARDVKTIGRVHLPEAQDVIFDFEKCKKNESGGILLRGPGVNNSFFLNCQFKHGKGIPLVKPNPKTKVIPHWKEVIKVDPKVRPVGGAVSLGDCTDIDFRNCRFEGCSAYTAGALAAFAVQSLRLRACEFVDNQSGFGGGAAFLQMSEVYQRGVLYQRNGTGSNYSDAQGSGIPYASGGAIYIGFRSYLDSRNCSFVDNAAEYVGGAIYLLDSSPARFENSLASICADSAFVQNRACGTKLEPNAAAGGAICLNGESRLDMTTLTLRDNRRGTKGGGDDKPDTLAKDDFKAQGFVQNGEMYLVLNVDEQGSSKPGKLIADVHSPKDRTLEVRQSPMKNPKSFGGERKAPIDTIVIHHTSAINWDEAGFVKQFGEQRKEFEQKLGPAPEGMDRKFDWRYCKAIFELYGVSSHYMIARDGTVYQLVSDDLVAHHAGESSMPKPDGRKGVNDFSLGIELISTHPDRDVEVRSGKVPAYTKEQMDSLTSLCALLVKQYRIPTQNIVGHDQIAPGRKTDPGPRFNWDQLKNDLAEKLK